MRHNDTPEGRSVRLLRIGEQIRHALASTLQRGDVRDNELEGLMISVSEVRVSPDLRQATAYVKALGGDDQLMLTALKRNTKYLRGKVARALTTKYTPELFFRLDESYDAGSKIDELLRSPEVSRDLGGDK